MKIRNGFVSNSSSSSFVIGLTGLKKTITYFDMYNIAGLIEVKKKCLEMKVGFPGEINVIEEKLKKPLERITEKDVIEIKEEQIEIPSSAILSHYEDEITIDLSKIPDGVKFLRFSYMEDRWIKKKKLKKK